MAFKNQFFTYTLLLLSTVVLNDLMASSHNEHKHNAAQSEWTIPFKLVKQLIVVEAFIDGTKGNFIVDTGSEFLILNSKYFNETINQGFQATDVGKNTAEVGETFIRFSWSNKKGKSYYSLLTDLTDIEELLRIKIMGYIGYEVLKRNEVIFDYQQRNLTFFELDKKGKRKNISATHQAPSETIPLMKNRFQPYLLVSVGTEQFRLGIDSGAGLNLIDKDRVKDFGSNFQEGIAHRIAGFSGNVISVPSGTLTEMNILDFIWPSMKCVVKDMGYINRTLSTSLDGLLGFEFLNQYKISINYRKNEMYIWNPEFKIASTTDAR